MAGKGQVEQEEMPEQQIIIIEHEDLVSDEWTVGDYLTLTGIIVPILIAYMTLKMRGKKKFK